MNFAIFGRRHSGKTTAADMFVSAGFERMSLADPIKNMLLVLPDITQAHVRGERKEEVIPLYGRTARHMMQTLGTEWRDYIDPDMWLNIWKARAEGVGGVICDDGRFAHELEFFRSQGVVTIGIFRPATDGATDEASEHASERFPFERSDFDHVIENSGTLTELQDAVDSIIVRVLNET